ncbi:MAG: hypothetical protein ACR2L2_13960 [Acidobacteriota bacterium]
MKRDDWDSILKGEPATPPPAEPPLLQTAATMYRKRPAPGRGLFYVVAAAVVIALVLGVWALVKQDQSNQELKQQLALVNKRLEDSDGRLADLQSGLTVTQQRIGVTQRDLDRAEALAVRLKSDQERNVLSLKQELQEKANTEQVAAVQQEAEKKLGALSGDIGSVKGEVTETKAVVETNRQDLEKTKKELASLNVVVNDQGKLIAVNGDGLDELRRKGERDYVEFTLSKKDKVRQVHDIRLELRKADTKKQRSDIRVFANDAQLDRKVAINEPVYFRQGKDNVLYELVVNEVRKDVISGYLSVPKHRALAIAGPKKGLD